MLKTIAIRLLLLPVALAFACLLAGLYGALHNQVSYTVSPQYFHEFKFIQFRIPPELQNRLGAAMVGWRASWWMGLMIGAPVYLLCQFARGTGAMLRIYALAALSVVLTTFLLGLGALAFGYLAYGPDHLPAWMEGRAISDPVAFARAGNMHNFAYLGGLVGLVFGAVIAVRGALASRRTR